MWFVYLLRCTDDSLYCGITNNLLKRLNTHNKGKGSKYTRSRLPVQIVWCEEVKTKSCALKREAFIKKLSKNAKELIVKESQAKSEKMIKRQKNIQN